MISVFGHRIELFIVLCELDHLISRAEGSLQMVVLCWKTYLLFTTSAAVECLTNIDMTSSDVFVVWPPMLGRGCMTADVG